MPLSIPTLPNSELALFEPLPPDILYAFFAGDDNDGKCVGLTCFLHQQLLHLGRPAMAGSLNGGAERWWAWGQQ
jgi:hypothetical protein